MTEELEVVTAEMLAGIEIPEGLYSEEDIRRIDYLKGLLEAVDFLAKHPNLIPYSNVSFMFFEWDKKKFAQKALELGAVSKEPNDNYYSVVKKFGPHSFDLYISREKVCTKVVVAKEEVEVEDYDEEELAKLTKVKKVRTVEKTEWLCPPSLHAMATDEDDA